MVVERSLRIAMVAISINKLTKNFGDKTVVSIPEFCFPANEIIGLVGNNGAGKTTLFRLILNLLKANGGSVDFLFEECQEDSPTDGLPPTPSTKSIANYDDAWKSQITAYLDEAFLIEYLTAEEFFSFILKAHNIQTIGLEERLEDYREFLSDEILGQTKYIRELSAGNKQKGGIVAALLPKASAVILDEPFNFLDPSSQNLLKKLLVDYKNKYHASVIISSHNLQHTIDISDRVVLMEHGEIIKNIDHITPESTKILSEYFKSART